MQVMRLTRESTIRRVSCEGGIYTPAATLCWQATSAGGGTYAQRVGLSYGGRPTHRPTRLFRSLVAACFSWEKPDFAPTS